MSHGNMYNAVNKELKRKGGNCNDPDERNVCVCVNMLNIKTYLPSGRQRGFA